MLGDIHRPFTTVRPFYEELEHGNFDFVGVVLQ